MSGRFKGSLWYAYAAGSLFCALSLSACAPYIRTESRLHSLFTQGRYRQAVSFLDSHKKSYGRNNLLLYLLNKGCILHLSGEYRQSIDVFEKAKQEYDRLYTKSVTGIAGTWMINEYAAPYRGEDFERVMINIFQAINYSLLGNIEEALVEARDVDSKLRLINNRYAPDEKNAYKEDAFARFFMGILYEALESAEGYNDARVSYSKALEIYRDDYAGNYNLRPPSLLKEKLLAAAEFMEKPAGKAQKAEVYLIQYNGLLPLKTETAIPIPLPDGYIVSLAFPQYKKREPLIQRSRFEAKNSQGVSFEAEAELAQDIGAIAGRSLENRKARLIAKAALSAAAKYFAEKEIEKKVKKEYGENSGLGFRVAGSLFNLITNKADLRSWQTLPSRISICGLLLEPGEYNLAVINSDSSGNFLSRQEIGSVRLSAGEKKFCIARGIAD